MSKLKSQESRVGPCITRSGYLIDSMRIGLLNINRPVKRQDKSVLTVRDLQGRN